MPHNGMENYTDLALALRAVWTNQFVLNSAVMPLYSPMPSGGAAERTRGLEGLASWEESNGPINYDDFEEGNLKTFTHRVFKKGIRLTREEIEDNQVNLMQNKVRLLAESGTRTIAEHMANPFINAFSTSGDGAGAADGLALCSATGRSTGKMNLANKGTTALDATAVKATRALMRKFKDSRGAILNVNPDTLVVPVDLEENAYVIAESTLKSGSANNDANINLNRLNVIVEPMLTDANDWFMVDSRLARLHLHWFWRVMPEFKEDPTGEYNDELRMRGYARFSYGADASYWIYGHQVT